MSAVAKVKDTRQVARFSRQDLLNIRDINYGNMALVKRLIKGQQAEFDSTSFPDGTDKVFKRRIIVMKCALEPGEVNPPSEEMVTLEDLNFTDLPWMGPVTVAPFGPRQLRAKNAFFAVVELVREIDGYLWLLKIDVGSLAPRDYTPITIEVEGPTRRDSSFKLYIDNDLSQLECVKHFNTAPEVPESLVKELTDIGFVRKGNRFTGGTEDTDVCLNIQVILYGKILTPL